MAGSTTASIRIKGIREGILIALDTALTDHSFEDVLQQLDEELRSKAGFLEGSRALIEVGYTRLARERVADLQMLLSQHGLELWTVLANHADTREAARALGLATRVPGSNTDLDGNELTVAAPVSASAATTTDAEQPGAILLRETIRSGRSIFHEGHVVVIGDVNPGAEIIAGGNVIVWGRLRGLVHAGALGDQEAVICALELSPTQLRISSKIAIPPNERESEWVPEMATIRDGQIVADAWRLKD